MIRDKGPRDGSSSFQSQFTVLILLFFSTKDDIHNKEAHMFFSGGVLLHIDPMFYSTQLEEPLGRGERKENFFLRHWRWVFPQPSEFIENRIDKLLHCYKSSRYGVLGRGGAAAHYRLFAPTKFE